MGVLHAFPLDAYLQAGYKTLIETGTGAGTGLDFACTKAFERLFSCEIVPLQALKLKERYAIDPRVTISNQLSPAFLEDLFASGAVKASDRCIFWLDAHYPFADLYGVPYDTEKDLVKRLPLEAELDVLFAHQRFHDIIIADDLRIYERVPGIQNLDQMGLGHIARYDAPDFLARWRETHVVEKLPLHEGYIVMMPKRVST